MSMSIKDHMLSEEQVSIADKLLARYSDDDEKSKKIRKRINKYKEPLKEFQELSELERQVRITRINRITAANRLLETESFLQGINIYYSCISVVLAILSLLSEKREVSVWSAIITAILAVSIVYLNAQKYGNRSQELKTNYIALHNLLFDIYAAQATNDIVHLQEYEERYCELLQTSENHTDFDYLTQKRKNQGLETWTEKAFYLYKCVLKYAVRGVLVVAPIVLLVFLTIRGDFSGILY